MERVAHRRRPNKAAVTLSDNGGGFSGTGLYDDVYGGPPKFGASNLAPRFEDYAEIFGTFRAPRATSVPVLDLPLVHEADALFDPRSDDFNYAEVFGALDFAVPDENLFHQPGALNGDSSEEAWTSAETDSFSGESDHYENNQSFSNGDIFQSVEGNTEFNLSYHKVHSTSNEHMCKGKTHMTRPHAVSGFSRVYGETTRFHRTVPSFQVADDIDLDAVFSADNVKGNHMRKTMPHLCNFTSGEQNFGSDLNLQNEFIRDDSHSSEAFITVSGVSLRSIPSQAPAPSRPPPVNDEKKGDINRFHSNTSLVASEETSCSPPFLDVEFGMKSSDAASDDAMKEAMLRAEAKLRRAKESKKGTNGVYESHVKSSYVVNNNEAKSTKDMSRINRLDDDTMQGSYDKRHSKTKISVKDERQKPKKVSPAALDTLEGKRILNTFDEKITKQSRSSQESDKITGIRIWKEPEFFELEGTEDSGMVNQHIEQTNILVQDSGNLEHVWKEIEASNMQEKNTKVKAIKENYQWEEYDKKSKAAREAYDHDKNTMRSEASDETWRQIEHVKKENVAKMFEQEEHEKNVRMGHRHGKIEDRVTEADQSGSLEDVPKMDHKGHKQVKIQKPKEVHRQTPFEDQLSMSLEEYEKKPKEVGKLQQNVKKHKLSVKMKESGKSQSEAFILGQAKDEEKLKNFVELEDIVETPKEEFKQRHTRENEACIVESEMRFKPTNQILNKKGKKEAHEKVETEESLEGSFKIEESNEGLRHAFEWDENEKKHMEDFQLDLNEIRLKEAFKKREINEMENEAYERDQNRKNFKEACHGYGEGRRLEEAGENKGVQKVLSEVPGKEQNDVVLNGAQWKSEIEIMLNQTFSREGSITLSNENCLLQQYEMNIDVGRMEKDEQLDKAFDKMEGNEGENMMFAKATDQTWETESDENLFESASIHEENIVRLEVSQESVAGQEIGKTRTECKVREKELEEIGVENPLAKEKIRAPEMVPGDTEHSGTQSGKVDDTVTEADCRRSTEAAAPAIVKESVNVQKTAEWFHVGQPTERKEKSFNETPATVVKDAERMRRESESEKDYLRKIGGGRDSEREREKDRMAVEKARLDAERERERKKDREAVDRAIFEARDRAYAEACERAERVAFESATAEAQQRALAEAKERLEKACAEARDKSYLDKVATEARLKAKRAAVEKETIEAQERAKEKLKDEKVTLESRERLERSVSDNFGFCSREGARQDSSLSFKDFSSSEGCRYSLYGAASFSERSEREGESAQRCRARLERHRRTAERAAKALAEKNMRDLLVQKELAERNRLAETLDAEVRRWSSGKEGNLRALLSTLQYILGPDSGWQSIPLTEVITSAGAKKAYRKATLVVHPDKLQQRGASIQHKYICEKVFDLLKDAWYKFNSEER